VRETGNKITATGKHKKAPKGHPWLRAITTDNCVALVKKKKKAFALLSNTRGRKNLAHGSSSRLLYVVMSLKRQNIKRSTPTKVLTTSTITLSTPSSSSASFSLFGQSFVVRRSCSTLALTMSTFQCSGTVREDSATTLVPGVLLLSPLLRAWRCCSAALEVVLKENFCVLCASSKSSQSHYTLTDVQPAT
jgi:hypothetical protein